MSFFNGFTRIVCQDYNGYLGLDAIFNERCFLHLRKTNNTSILMICRERSGSYEYEQIKSLSKKNPIDEINNNNEKKKIIKVNNSEILKFIKFKKAEKKYQYLGIEYNPDEFGMYNDEFDRSVMMNDTTNLDIPSESQVMKQDENNKEYDQIIEVFNFINNVTNRNNKENMKKKKKKEAKKFRSNSIQKLSKEENDFNVSGVKNYYPKFEESFKQNDIYYDQQSVNSSNSNNSSNYFKNRSILQSLKIDSVFQSSKSPEYKRNRTKQVDGNIQLINFNDFFNDNNKNSNPENKNNNQNEYIDFTQINNNYIDNEDSKPLYQRDSYINLMQNNSNYFNNNNNNIYHSSISSPINYNNLNNQFNQLNDDNSMNFNVYNNNQGYNNIQNNNNNNINNNFFNDSHIGRNKTFNYKTTNINLMAQSSSFNSSKISSDISNNFNNNNNIYYPTQNVFNNTNNKINNQQITPFIPPFPNNNMSNSQQLTQYIPQYFNNSNNNSNNNSLGPNYFSQTDLTFLGGNMKVNNSKEDYLIINPNKPEIFSEIKEKIYYYCPLKGNNINKILAKGYIGINIVPPSFINNKQFYINFNCDKWKDHNYFINRDMNQKIQKITEMIYKIPIIKQQNAVKLITYSINQQILNNIKIIEIKFSTDNFGNLLYIFNYNKNYEKYVYKIEVCVNYKIPNQNWQNIGSDGKIISKSEKNISVVYNKNVKGGKINFGGHSNGLFRIIGKIIFKILLKNSVVSVMQANINYFNAKNQSREDLICRKSTLVCFEYS